MMTQRSKQGQRSHSWQIFIIITSCESFFFSSFTLPFNIYNIMYNRVLLLPQTVTIGFQCSSYIYIIYILKYREVNSIEKTIGIQWNRRRSNHGKSMKIMKSTSKNIFLLDDQWIGKKEQTFTLSLSFFLTEKQRKKILIRKQRKKNTHSKTKETENPHWDKHENCDDRKVVVITTKLQVETMAKIFTNISTKMMNIVFNELFFLVYILLLLPQHFCYT